MAKTKEAQLLDRMIKHLQKMENAGLPVWWTRIRKGPWQDSGLPDLHVTYYGLSIWIEVKGTDGKVSKLQQHVLSQIRAAGGVAEAVNSMRGFIYLFNQES